MGKISTMLPKFRLRRETQWIILAMLIFVTTSMLAIILNSTVGGYGLNPSWSISKYVGLETWSAVMFAIANCFVAGFMARYLWWLGLEWKMSKLYFILVVAMAVMLLWLSFCPVGYFDDDGAMKSVISWMHIRTSRMMFVIMMLVAALIVLCRRAGILPHALCVAYLVYAIFCVIGELTQADWFAPLTMIFEGMFLLGFMVIAACCGLYERVRRRGDRTP